MHILMKIYIRHLQSKWKKRRKKIKDTGETNRCSYLHIQYSLVVQIQWTQIIVTDYAGNYMAWSNNSLVQANENITWGGRVEGYILLHKSMSFSVAAIWLTLLCANGHMPGLNTVYFIYTWHICSTGNPESHFLGQFHTQGNMIWNLQMTLLHNHLIHEKK